MPEYDYQPTEAEQALQAAQGLLEQGELAAAEPILKGLLNRVGNDSIEGALCLTNLAQIYQQKGDTRSAIDCSLKLISHKQLYKKVPQGVKAAHAQRAADLLASIGETNDAEHFRKLADKIESTPAEAPSLQDDLNPSREADSKWVLRALQDVAYHHRHKKDGDANPWQSGAANPTPSSPAASTRGGGGGGRGGAKQEPEKKSRYGNDDDIEEEYAKSDKNKKEEPIQQPERGFDIRDMISGGTSGASNTDFSARGSFRDEDGASEPRTVRKPTASRRTKTSETQRPTFSRDEIEASVPQKAGRRAAQVPRSDAPSLLQQLANAFSSGPSQNKPAKKQNYSEPQKVTTAVVQNAGAMNAGMLVIALIIGFIAAWNLAPRGGNPALEFRNSPTNFRDANHERELWLISPSECEIASGPIRERIKLRYYFGDWRDVLSIVFGQGFEKFGYLSKNKLGLKDSDGTYLYVNDSPELKLAERAQEMMLDANNFFRDKKHYPETDAEMKELNWTFSNPYLKPIKKVSAVTVTTPADNRPHKTTKQREAQDAGKESSEAKILPHVTSQSFGSDKEDSGVDKLRPEVYGKLDLGDYWQEQKRAEGGIECCSIQFLSSRGPIKCFVETVATADGGILKVNDQHAFYLASEDGRPHKDKTQKQAKYTTAWITIAPLDQNMLFLLKNAAGMTFLVASFFSLAMALSSSKKAASRGLFFFGAGAFLLISGLYFVISHVR